MLIVSKRRWMPVFGKEILRSNQKQAQLAEPIFHISNLHVTRDLYFENKPRTFIPKNKVKNSFQNFFYFKTKFSFAELISFFSRCILSLSLSFFLSLFFFLASFLLSCQCIFTPFFSIFHIIFFYLLPPPFSSYITFTTLPFFPLFYFWITGCL